MANGEIIKYHFLLQLQKTPILDYLLKDGILNAHDVDRLRLPHLTEKDVVSHFVNILPWKGTNSTINVSLIFGFDLCFRT